jgi:aryl-alcohol dehydrogenase-like predicted oxidoreductase/NAD-dependent dihydropyrimidine dehydrogenase PreA subunit
MKREESMPSEKMGRRKFMKNLSSAFLGVASSHLLGRLPSAHAEKKPALEYRILGKTGLKVTAVSMGVMNCNDPAVLLRAFDLGINFYDTADCYMRGRNEEMVGKAFEGKRHHVFIQTKVHAHDEKQMRASVERSLRRLRTDYIDILVWHGHSSPEEVSDPNLFEFMSKMKKEGKTRFAGFSTHRHMALLLREAVKSNFHDVALVSYNFTHSKDLKEAVDLAAKSGVGIVAMKTQAGGYKKERMRGLSPHQAALKYVLMDQNISCAVPGVTTIDQIEECAAVMGTSFSKRNLNELKQYQSFLQGRICTLCGGCMGECPDGLVRSDLLRIVMYHDGYQNDVLAKEVLNGTPLLKNIERCFECSSCSVMCRRGLDVKAQIKMAQEFIMRS